MKLNQRIFYYTEEENLIEKQELNGHSVELYHLNAYPDLLNEFTNKGKFAVWSSVDGSNYKLFVEDGYYEKLKPLYQPKINQIWLDFWDACERISTKFRNIIMPLALVVILIVFGSNFLIPNQAVSLGVAIGIAAAYFLGVMIFKRVVNKKITEYNSIAVADIKKIMGEKKFAKLLDDQRSYIDEYFKYNGDPLAENDDPVVEDVQEDLVEAEAAEAEAVAKEEEANLEAEAEEATKEENNN